MRFIFITFFYQGYVNCSDISFEHISNALNNANRSTALNSLLFYLRDAHMYELRDSAQYIQKYINPVRNYASHRHLNTR